ncbi:E3 ubiquitin-protein ligase Topors [Candoia aspera]|uniref:E3 ubiquitin-protein ligase Topors n=1 Tax=Candoia aspera TaxID=51853 RepID=UPI002FD7D1DA
MCDPRELRGRAAGANGRRRQRPKPNLPSVTDEFTTDNCSPKSGTNRSHQTMPAEASPDSKCPICLDKFENVAYLDRCWHRFCFRCVLEWSKNKAECPLCKQPFHSIVHSMRSEDDFKVYTVRPSEAESFANPNGRRFRYRTTLTRERRASVNPRRSSSSRRTVSPPDSGILFEGLSTQTTRQRDAEMYQMIRRLASRRQASLEGRSMRQIQEQEIIIFRRALYRSGMRVRNIEDGGRYRDISAEFFRRNPACLHRLVPWLKRELTVLFGAHGSLVNIVQHIIMSNVTRYDLESQAFADDLKPFLLHRTEHFLHEFINFARCPFNIEAYDQHANYDCPAPSYEEGSRSESSIITISPDETDSQALECNAFRNGIGQAPWDDETPGPSYSSSEQIHAAISTALDTSESSDEEPSASITGLQTPLPASVEMNGDSCDSSDNCVIVGYVKPLAERTPELVELSSDSEDSVDDGKNDRVQTVQPIQYHSFSDTDASGYASPFSVGSRDGSASNKNNVSLSSRKRKPKRSEKDKDKLREASWLQSSPSKEDCSDYSLSKRRRSESYVQRSHRERHSLKSKRKHRSMEKGKRKRGCSRHKHKKDKKRSRTRDKSPSRKSQTLSLSSESVESRDLSRSRSRSREYSRPSKSKGSDYYLRDSYQSKYRWEYTFYSRNTIRDGYESSHRRRTQVRAEYSRQSASPDYRMQSFSERTNSRYPRGHTESRYYYYERRRSRSRSSSRSRTPPRGPDRGRSEKPSGKRKYKTRHLESAQRGGGETSPTKESSTLEKSSPGYPAVYQKAASFADMQAQAETPQEKRKKRSRSPSIEIIYERKITDVIRCHKKKQKRIKKPHKNPASSSPLSSPVVITIDSDSDRDSEIQENTDSDSSISWTRTIQQNDRMMEAPPSSLEARDCSYERPGGGAESLDKEGGVPSREKGASETPNTAFQMQGTVSRDTATVTVSSTAFVAESQTRIIETEPFSQLRTARTSLLLGLSKIIRENSHQLHSPEQNV